MREIIVERKLKVADTHCDACNYLISNPEQPYICALFSEGLHHKGGHIIPCEKCLKAIESGKNEQCPVIELICKSGICSKITGDCVDDKCVEVKQLTTKIESRRDTQIAELQEEVTRLNSDLNHWF